MATKTASTASKKVLNKGIQSLQNLTVSQLKEVAKSTGVEISSRATKEKIISSLNVAAAENQSLAVKIEYFAGEY